MCNPDDSGHCDPVGLCFISRFMGSAHAVTVNQGAWYKFSGASAHFLSPERLYLNG